jgi:hypothetical protein
VASRQCVGRDAMVCTAGTGRLGEQCHMAAPELTSTEGRVRGYADMVPRVVLGRRLAGG